ncbi:MAG TPA: cytochrome c3 family protein [Verrucomicrobiae bacterium]|nr:cytochrome c3 family protein [Verrucomicrobiae bacterium]
MKLKVKSGLVYGFTGLFSAAFVAINLTGIITLIAFFLSPLAFAEDSIAKNQRINAQCLSCHGTPGFKVDKGSYSIDLYVSPEEYNKSIHGTNACTSCHDNPGMSRPANPVYGQELAKQVNHRCQSCHDDVAGVYKSSVHGERVLNGQQGALCYDCHGKHDILQNDDPNSQTYRLNVPDTCTRCHQGNEATAYQYSFHGTSVKLGYTKGATCADCHGTHTILAPENPASSVNKANEPATCAKCHLQAEENFAKGNEHVVPQDKQNAFPLWVIWKIFIGLILFDIFKDGTIAIFELIRRIINERKKS